MTAPAAAERCHICDREACGRLLRPSEDRSGHRANCFRYDWCGCGKFFCDENAIDWRDEALRLREEVSRLRAGLERFGRHADDCASRHSWGDVEPCDCGLAAALEGT